MTILNEITPECPRCGYDLRGTTESWQDTCPLQGTCTECGLTIHWAEVLVPAKFEPPWCVEFVQPLRRFGWASVRTAARSGRPFRYWGTLKMSMPLHPRRLAAYVAILLLPVLAGGVVVQTVAAVRMRYDLQQELVRQRVMVRQNTARLQAQLDNLGLTGARRTRVQQRLIQFQLAAATPLVIDRSYAAAIAEAVFFPWRSSSTGTQSMWAGRITGYPAPRYLHATLLRQSGNSPNLSGVHNLSYTIAGVALAFWVALTMPLAFVLLPISRRRAKVRWVHLARVACYGMVLPSAVVTVMLACVALGYAANGLQPAMHSVAHSLGRYGLMILTIGWWVAAIRRYLQIPHGWAVSPVLAILLILILVATVFVTGRVGQ